MPIFYDDAEAGIFDAIQLRMMNANATHNNVLCPVCGAELRMIKAVASGWDVWLRYRCTCGHCEDRKEDRSMRSESHRLAVVEGFQEVA